MNYDRKLTGVYLDFIKSIDKKNKDNKEKKTSNIQSKNAPELDDTMFETP